MPMKGNFQKPGVPGEKFNAVSGPKGKIKAELTKRLAKRSYGKTSGTVSAVRG